MNAIYRFLGNPSGDAGSNIFDSRNATDHAELQYNGLIYLDQSLRTSVTIYNEIPDNTDTLEIIYPSNPMMMADFNVDFSRRDFGPKDSSVVQSIIFADSDKNVIPGSFVGNPPALVNVPSGAKYIRICYFTGSEGQIYIYRLPGHLLNPVYDSSLSIVYKKEEDQEFFRKSLSGKLDFVGDDYDWIMSRPFASVIELEIQKSMDGGRSWSDYADLQFTRIDCDINSDDKKISVQPNTRDDYTDILKGWEKEFNLPELSVATLPTVITKRPLLQIYVLGDSSMSCYLSGMAWEQSVNAITDEDALQNTYHFLPTSQLVQGIVTGEGSVPSIYTGVCSGKVENATETNALKKLVMKFADNASTLTITTYNLYETVKFTADLTFAGQTLYHFESVKVIPIDTMSFKMGPVPETTATGMLNVDLTSYSIYMRFLLDTMTLNGLPTYELGADDMSLDNRNYRRCIGYDADIFEISAKLSDDPTEWGMADDGRYFLPPDTTGDWYPVGRAEWANTSLWLATDPIDDNMEKKGRATYILRDNYLLWSVISVLLGKISSVTHSETAECSAILYSSGLTNQVGGQRGKLLITPKTNILNGPYSQPQQVAKITLKAVLDMLANTMQLYWFVESGKLKIEHISYFKNGGSYTTRPGIGYDLTQMSSPKLGKKWAFDTAAWTYDKADIPERLEFSWMDDCSEPFDGMPIEMLSPLVNDGDIESVSVAQFTSDIDMMLLNPSSISEGGFALFNATRKNILDVSDPYIVVASGKGIYEEDGSVSYSLTGRGSGWLYAKMRVTPGETYTIVMESSHIIVIPKVVWVLFKSDGSVESYVPEGSARITTTSDTAYLGIAWRSETNSNPTTPYSVLDLLGSGSILATQYSLPFVRAALPGKSFSLQNGLLAFVYLQRVYWKDNLPSWEVELNGQEVTADGVRRTKKQDVAFPAGPDDPDTQELVRTSIGDGEIQEISVNLSSRMAQATLVYDIEQ